MKSLSCVRLCVTLWIVAYQASPSMGFSRQEYWSGLPFPSSGDLPNHGNEPGSPALETYALTSEPPGKPLAKGEGNSSQLQYPCLEHPMDRGVCRATVCGVAKSQTRLTGHAHMDCSPQASSGRGILQARILEWAAISFSRIIQMDHIKFYFIHFIKKNFFRHAERHVGS